MSIDTPADIVNERCYIFGCMTDIESELMNHDGDGNSRTRMLRAKLASHKARLVDLQVQELAFFRAHREKLEEEVAVLRRSLGETP